MSFVNIFIENGINKNSAVVYNYNLQKLIKLSGKDLSDSTFVDGIIDIAINNNSIPINSKINYIVAYRKYCDIYKIKVDPKIEQLVKNLNVQNSYKEPSKKESDNKVNLKYIEQFRDTYKNKLKSNFTIYDVYYLICSLYTYMLPLRSQDYYDTVIYNGDNPVENKNYYHVGKKELVLGVGKNIRNIGIRTIKIPDILHDVIMDFHNKSESEYLICSSKKTKLNESSFSQTFNNCLKKKVSSSMIRKCIMSDKIDAGMSAKERKDASVIMGHSLQTQQLTYSRFSDVLHPDNENLDYLIRRYNVISDQLKDINDKILKLL